MQYAAVSEAYGDRVIIGEHTGVSLETVGYLLGRQGDHFRSLFLKVIDPVSNANVCQSICEADADKAVSQLTRQREECVLSWKTGKSFAPEIKRIARTEGIGCSYRVF